MKAPADRKDRHDDVITNLGFGTVLVLFGIAILVWVGAALAAYATQGRGPGVGLGGAFTAMLNLRQHLDHPAVAWPEPARSRLPDAGGYWAATGGVIAVGLGLVVGTWRITRGGRETLDRRRRLGVPTQARLARPRDLAPLIVRGPAPGRLLVGRMGRHLLATEGPPGHPRRRRRNGGYLGAVALTGSSRSGKTRLIIKAVNGYGGPAILSSVKTDLLSGTLEARRRLGEVKIFDPTGVTSLPSALWTPLRGAGTLQGALAAAKALVDAAPRGERDTNSYWLKQAEILLAGMMWVAAVVDGLSMRELCDWVLGQDRPTESGSGAVAPLLRALADGGDRDKAEVARRVQTWLKGLWEMDPRTSSSIYATARTAVWPWVDPKVAALAMGNDVDLPWLLSSENTLYVVAPPADQDRLAPVLGGIISDLVNQAFDLSLRRAAQLDPPLLVVLDEAANTPLRKLPEWASTVAGIGVHLVTIWQSKAQLEALYGPQAETILTNHLTKLFFAGMSDTYGLDYVGRLLGVEHVEGVLDRSLRDPSHASPAQVPLVPPNVLREMRPGEALLIHGTLPPAHIRPLA